MRASQLLAPTLREVPAEAEIISHKFMLRAGMVRKVTGGVYAYLPLAWRTLRKIEQIIREEMDSKGGQELQLPIMQPAEIWRETGRWDVYGEEMFKLQDRHNREFCLGPTHEEIITTLVRGDVRSYRQLPLLLYQIHTKYRDEIRPRFGLMRGREFIMKDLYSFDRDEQGLDVSYQRMYDAYCAIFTRCGLKYRAVEADSGAIGGNNSHEFMVLAEAGEDDVAYCDACGYGANVEKAECVNNTSNQGQPSAIERVATPDRKTIVAVAEYLAVPIETTMKALVYQADQELVMVVVRGDHEVNEVKLAHLLDVTTLNLATPVDVKQVSGVEPGFVGPVGITTIKIIADLAVMQLTDAVCGANVADVHYLHVLPGRDFSPQVVADIRLIHSGDVCPHCGKPIQVTRGVEVGHIFKLGVKYSQALKANFLDENGTEVPFVMGCYGIGVSRVMAAAIEQNHDDKGIIWPMTIAPFHVVVVPVNSKDTAQMQLAESVYQQLCQAGLETVLDDRNERPGVKFKDADLIGYPLRITIGPRAMAQQALEVNIRKTGETLTIPQTDFVNEICNRLRQL